MFFWGYEKALSGSTTAEPILIFLNFGLYAVSSSTLSELLPSESERCGTSAREDTLCTDRALPVPSQLTRVTFQRPGPRGSCRLCSLCSSAHKAVQVCSTKPCIICCAGGQWCAVYEEHPCVSSVSLGDWKQMERRESGFFLLAELRLSSTCGLVENHSSTWLISSAIRIVLHVAAMRT